MKNFIFMLVFVTMPVFAQENTAPATPPSANKPLNLNPEPPLPPVKKEKSHSVRTLRPLSVLCVVGQDKYATHGKDDENRCKGRGGKLQIVSGNQDGLVNMDEAPPPPRPMPNAPGSYSEPDRVERNVHHNPLDPVDSN